MASVMPVRNETKSNVSRVTKEGRKLTYQLNVIQQPERARACGSGAKSSADRRPVDPPPVVELRIFEGENMDNEITFSYNANFFLFTTLEQARPIAQGRVPQNPAAFPVLTGMPVSGMAYLDRPAPAGYFLFPDLSVRHEGKYRLSFNLYEEVKEGKDADVNTTSKPHEPRTVIMPDGLDPKAKVDWRLEVRSKPFTVYSAKKFPGLSESTALSRIVAEQGCRVRIRRDVRMRRRDAKAPPEFDDMEDDSYTRARATPSPDPYQQQNQHSSRPSDAQPPAPANHSGESNAYQVEPQRRQSVDHSYQPQYQPMHHPTSNMMPGQPAAYGHNDYAVSPAHQYNPQYSQAPQGMMQQSPVYAQQPGYFPAMPNQQFQHSQSMQPQHAHRESVEHPSHSKRDSMSYSHNYPAQTTASQPYGYPDGNFVRPPPPYQQAYGASNTAPSPRTPTPSMGGHALPPLKAPKPVEPKHEAPPTATSGTVSRPTAPLQRPSYDGTEQKPVGGPYSAHSESTDASRSSKRPWATVFDATPYDQAFHHGMRPSEAHHGAEPPQPQIEEDDYDKSIDFQNLKMQYKRADGTEISRRLPTGI